jgi:hypothetical protein
MAPKLTKAQRDEARADYIENVVDERIMPELMDEVTAWTDQIVKRLKITTKSGEGKVRRSILSNLHIHITRIAFK